MRNRKLLKIVLLVLSLVSIAIFISYYFLYESIKSDNENTSALLSQISIQSKKQAYLASAKDVIDTIKPKITLIDSSVIPKDGDIGFIESLEGMSHGDRLSVTIDSLDEEDNLGSNSVVALKVMLRTNGTWDETYKLLARLEALPYKVKISQYSLVNAGNDAWQSSFEMRVLKNK